MSVLFKYLRYETCNIILHQYNTETALKSHSNIKKNINSILRSGLFEFLEAFHAT